MGKVFSWLKRLVRGQTLASQIFLGLFLVAFIASVGVDSFAYFSARHRIKDQLTEQFSEEANLVSTYIAENLATAYSDVQLLSFNPIITSHDTSLEEKAGEMLKAHWLHGQFEDITLLSPQGYPLESTSDYRYTGSLGDPIGTEVFKEALAGHLTMSDAQLVDPGHMVIVVGAPVFDPDPSQHGKINFIITAQMNMERIWQITDSMKIGDTGYVTMVNEHDRYIAYPPNNNMPYPQNQRMLLQPIAHRDVSAKVGSLFSYRESYPADEEGNKLIEGDKRTGLLSQPISESFWINKGWRVMISQNNGEAFASLNQTRWLIFWGLLVVLLFFLVFGVLISRRISRPMQLLAQGTQRIASGDFAHRVNIKRRDEIGDLAQAYNVMASKLEQREADREYLQQLRKLVVVWAAVSGTLSMEKFVSNLTEVILDSYECESVWLMLVAKHRLESRAFISRRPEARQAIEKILGQDINQVSFDTRSDMNLFTQAFNSGLPVFLEDAISSGQDIVQSLLSGEPGAVVAVPLRIGEECRAVLVVGKRVPFSAEEREMMLALAVYSAIALENARLYEIARRQSQEKSRLYELAGAMSSSLQYHEVLKRALDGVMSLIPSPEAAWTIIDSFDERTNTFIYEASVGVSDIEFDSFRFKLDEASRQWFARMFEGKVMMIQDTTYLPEDQNFPNRIDELMKRTGMKSWVIIPLMVRGGLIGSLLISNKLPVLPSEEQLEAIRNLANNIAIAIDNARMYETAQRQSQEKSRLYELAGVMSSSLQFHEVLERALDGVMSLVPSPETAWIVIASYDKLTGTITYEVSRGAQDIVLDGLKIKLDEASRLEIVPVLHGKVMMIQDLTDLPEKRRFPSYLAEMIDQLGIKSWLTIPLQVRGRSIGTLRICNRLPILPSEEQLEALRNLANNIAIAMDNARLYAEERQRATELQSLEQLKTDFMLAISHELKTPLTSLNVSAGLLQEEVKTVPGTPVNRLLTGMVNSVERLNRLVSDLLEAARLESSTLELNWEFADIVSTVKATAITFSTLMESKRQQFIMDISLDGLWAWVDLQRLEQIVANLLSNAYKFTPIGGQIRLVLKEEGKNFVLEVSDTGPGIHEDEQKRIFEPFYRAKGMPRHTGSGLGLSIARRLTELHGGSITVRSQPGQGATFIITIPKGVDKQQEGSSANS